MLLSVADDYCGARVPMDRVPHAQSVTRNRMTPLEPSFADHSMTADAVAQFMALCLGHPTHGYYMTRDPLGARGDFITAPRSARCLAN